jgi:hypothetical protein
MKINQVIKEYNVIGSSVRLDEIPEKYKKLPLIGRGATSLVFQKDEDTVILFTRDSIKAEWLCHSWGLELGKEVDRFNIGHKIHIRGMGEHDIIAIEMPKLLPLDNKNKKIVKDELKIYQQEKRGTVLKGLKPWTTGRRRTEAMNIELTNIYQEKYPDSILLPALEFMTNYGGSAMQDFLMRNFLQDSDGNIVLIDPLISTDIYELIQNNKK